MAKGRSWSPGRSRGPTAARSGPKPSPIDSTRSSTFFRSREPVMRTPWRLALAVTTLACTPMPAAESAADFRPDPLAVQRSGKGYRYPQAGWIVLHIEGDPYERGEQHGRLMAQEIVGFVRTFATSQGPKAPEE